uniref:Uncharacterized protein n=1 Tax=Eptatretus burgeri TaxID=7764 RepID=A0A8C4R1E5_EPTBU
MSEVMPYTDEKIGHFGDSEDVEQLAFTCRLQGGDGFFNGNGGGGGGSTGQAKRPPKLGQIGRSQRGEDVIVKNIIST